MLVTLCLYGFEGQIPIPFFTDKNLRHLPTLTTSLMACTATRQNEKDTVRSKNTSTSECSTWTDALLLTWTICSPPSTCVRPSRFATAQIMLCQSRFAYQASRVNAQILRNPERLNQLIRSDTTYKFLKTATLRPNGRLPCTTPWPWSGSREHQHGSWLYPQHNFSGQTCSRLSASVWKGWRVFWMTLLTCELKCELTWNSSSTLFCLASLECVLAWSNNFTVFSSHGGRAGTFFNVANARLGKSSCKL
jgi:hypothetical protein